MTSEEMERAIETLLNNQSNFEIQLERTNRTVAQVGNQIGFLADTQNDFMQAVTRHIDSQNQTNALLRDAQARTEATLVKLSEAQTRTEAALLRFSAQTEAALTRLADAQAHTDKRLDALIDIVRSGRNGQSQ